MSVIFNNLTGQTVICINQVDELMNKVVERKEDFCDDQDFRILIYNVRGTQRLRCMHKNHV